MKYQLAGLRASVLIHATLFVLAFGVSRLLITPSDPITIEIGILTGSVGAPRNEAREKIVPRQVEKKIAKPEVQQQEAYAETAVAEKPVAKQEQASVPEPADASLNMSEADLTIAHRQWSAPFLMSIIFIIQSPY